MVPHVDRPNRGFWDQDAKSYRILDVCTVSDPSPKYDKGQLQWKPTGWWVNVTFGYSKLPCQVYFELGPDTVECVESQAWEFVHALRFARGELAWINA